MKGNNDSLRRQLFGELNKRGLAAYRSDIVIDITGGQYTSTNDLTVAQVQTMLPVLMAGGYDWVKTGIKPEAPHEPAHLTPSDGDDAKTRNAIRRRIISKFIEMGASLENGKADMPFIYKATLHFQKKKLNDMGITELNKWAAVLQNNWIPWYYKKKAADSLFTIASINLNTQQNEQTQDIGHS